MGSTLVKNFCLLFAIALLLSLVACRSDISADATRDRDKQMKEVAKTMPGNDVPVDPADKGESNSKSEDK